MAALGLSPAHGPFAVAVSGGVDSMALTLLAADYAPVLALTVDHGLRPESAAEAARVQAFLKARGISHRTLRLDPAHWPPARGGLEARARLARYEALEEAAAAAGIRHLLLAHTLDDQAETLLLRLLSGSGLPGLGAMAASAPPLVVPDGPMRHRPLLGVSRARLFGVVAAHGWEPVDDPMNADSRFARVRLRRWLEDAPEPEQARRRIAAVARKLARAQAALDADVDRVLRAGVTVSPAGYGVLDPAVLADAPEEVALQALARIVQHVSGAAFPPREAALMRLLARITAPDFAGATLAGALLAALEPRRVLVCREPAATADPAALRPGRAVRWDGRFIARAGRELAAGWTLGALGGAWRRRVGAAFGRHGLRAVEAVPGPARPALACLKAPDGRIVAVAGIAADERTVGAVEVQFAPLTPLFVRRSSLSA